VLHWEEAGIGFLDAFLYWRDRSMGSCLYVVMTEIGLLGWEKRCEGLAVSGRSTVVTCLN
jgi:hypothetical protein